MNEIELILFSIVAGLIIQIIKLFLIRCCFRPFGIYLGIELNKQKKILICPKLEKPVEKCKNASNSQTLLSYEQMKNWLKLRPQLDKDSKLEKFCESCFKATYYTFSFIYGGLILCNRPWTFDFIKIWDGFPLHMELDSGIWLHYVFSMGFYFSLLYQDGFILKRKKDFWMMIVHHMLTIILMITSWKMDIFRFGCIILTLHDSADIFLELGKAAKYAKFQKLLNKVFGVFVLTWIITRLIIYPFGIIRHCMFESLDIIGYTSHNIRWCTIFILLHLVLQTLNCLWSYFIFRMICNFFKNGRAEGDIRSDEDENESDEYKIDVHKKRI